MRYVISLEELEKEFKGIRERSFAGGRWLSEESKAYREQ